MANLGPAQRATRWKRPRLYTNLRFLNPQQNAFAHQQYTAFYRMDVIQHPSPICFTECKKKSARPWNLQACSYCAIYYLYVQYLKYLTQALKLATILQIDHYKFSHLQISQDIIKLSRDVYNSFFVSQSCLAQASRDQSHRATPGCSRACCSYLPMWTEAKNRRNRKGKCWDSIRTSPLRTPAWKKVVKRF